MEIERLLATARLDPSIRADALALEGSWWLELARYDEALRVAAVLDTFEDERSRAKGCNLRGAVYLQQGEYAEAFPLFEQAIALYGEEDTRSVAFVENNLGLLCTRIGDNDGAVVRYGRAVLAFERVGDVRTSARVRANLGIAYTRLGEKDLARETLEFALRSLTDDPNWQANVQGSLADLHAREGKHVEAEVLLREALTTRKRLGQGRQLAGGEIALAKVCLEQDRREECAEVLHRGLKRARALGLRESIADGLEVLAALHAAEGRFEEAYRTGVEMTASREALRADELQRLVIEAMDRTVLEEARRSAERRTREAEVLRLAKERAESALRARSEFVATTSHELRGPLTALLGACEILSLEPMDAESRKLVDLALSSARLLQAVVGDVLELSRLDAGEIRLSAQVLRIRELVHEVVALARGGHGLPVLVTFERNVPNCLIGDDARVRQVLLNVFENAVKYTERGEVRVGVEYRSETLLVRVEDQGPGIPEDFLHRLFEPFARASTPFVRSRRGTGLGLSIVSRLCEAMEGTIELVRTDESGTEFLIAIPMIEATETTEPSISSSEDVGRSVLLVEDDPVVSEVVGGMLRVLGHRVHPANSAEDAERILESWRPDLVISDHRMPGATGLELAQRWARSVRFVMLSGEVSADLTEKALDAGVESVLSKPVSLIVLRDTVRGS